jgi:hypothetical protein
MIVSIFWGLSNKKGRRFLPKRLPATCVAYLTLAVSLLCRWVVSGYFFLLFQDESRRWRGTVSCANCCCDELTVCSETVGVPAACTIAIEAKAILALIIIFFIYFVL